MQSFDNLADLLLFIFKFMEEKGFEDANKSFNAGYFPLIFETNFIFEINLNTKTLRYRHSRNRLQRSFDDRN